MAERFDVMRVTRASDVRGASVRNAQNVEEPPEICPCHTSKLVYPKRILRESAIVAYFRVILVLFVPVTHYLRSKRQSAPRKKSLSRVIIR